MALEPMRPMIRGIQKVLGVPRQRPPVWPPTGVERDPGESALAWLGFPAVTATAFFGMRSRWMSGVCISRVGKHPQSGARVG